MLGIPSGRFTNGYHRLVSYTLDRESYLTSIIEVIRRLFTYSEDSGIP
jgi:hypothetical protein